MGEGLKRARKAARATRSAPVPDADYDVCECGHYAHEHTADRCTVCTCNMWCWKLNAAPTAPSIAR
jgi:hypothetical protein